MSSIFAHRTSLALSLVLLMCLVAAFLLIAPNTIRAEGASAWSSKAPIPRGLSNLVAEGIDGLVYAGLGNATPPTVGGEFFRYDPATDEWTLLGNRSGVYNRVSVAIEGKMYVFGGVGPTNAVERYDPATNTWTSLASMPTARSATTAVVVGGAAYVLGGASPGPSAVVESYDPTFNAWTARAPMPRARKSLTAAAVGDKIYVFGGNTGSGPSEVVLDIVDVYDASDDSWCTLPPASNMSTPRANAAATVVDGKILLVGGSNKVVGDLDLFEQFDPTKANCSSSEPGIWTTLESMEAPRSALGLAAVDETLFAMGGDSGCCSSSQVEAYEFVVPSPMLIDSDGDTVPDDTDNCINTPNLDQLDTDNDESGDACDFDDDDDGSPDVDDDCPLAAEDDDGHASTDGCPDHPTTLLMIRGVALKSADVDPYDDEFEDDLFGPLLTQHGCGRTPTSDEPLLVSCNTENELWWVPFSYQGLDDGVHYDDYPYTVTHQTIETSVRRLDELIRHIADLRPDGRIILIGHSLGGAVAAEWATRSELTDDVGVDRLAVVTVDSPLTGIWPSDAEGAVCNETIGRGSTYRHYWKDSVGFFVDNREAGYQHLHDLCLLLNGNSSIQSWVDPTSLLASLAVKNLRDSPPMAVAPVGAPVILAAANTSDAFVPVWWTIPTRTGADDIGVHTLSCGDAHIFPPKFGHKCIFNHFGFLMSTAKAIGDITNAAQKGEVADRATLISSFERHAESVDVPEQITVHVPNSKNKAITRVSFTPFDGSSATCDLVFEDVHNVLSVSIKGWRAGTLMIESGLQQTRTARAPVLPGGLNGDYEANKIKHWPSRKGEIVCP